MQKKKKKKKKKAFIIIRSVFSFIDSEIKNFMSKEINKINENEYELIKSSFQSENSSQHSTRFEFRLYTF